MSEIPRLGVGTMNWGDPAELGRFSLSRLAYGPAGDLEEQRSAVEESIAGGVSMFDTAAMYGGGASERALGALTRGRPVFIAIAYMPLAMGALAGNYLHGRRPPGFRKYLATFRAKQQPKILRTVELLREIGAGYSRSPAQVALRWLIQQPGVVPIPGAKNRAQARHNAEVLSFSLSEAELEALDRATRE